MHIHEQNYTGNLHVRYEKGHMSYVAIYHVCTTGEGQATDWCLLLSTITVFLLQTQPEVLYYICPHPAPQSLSLILVLQCWGCGSKLQMLQFTALKPNEKDLQWDYLDWVPIGSKMLSCASELLQPQCSRIYTAQKMDSSSMMLYDQYVLVLNLKIPLESYRFTFYIANQWETKVRSTARPHRWFFFPNFPWTHGLCKLCSV